MPVSTLVEPLLLAEPKTIGIALSLGDSRIEGEIGPLYGDNLVQYRPSPFRPHQQLQAWLRHVLANAVHGPVTTHLVDNEDHCKFPPIESGEARDWLSSLLPWYRLGMRRPLALFPRAGWEWLREWHKSADEVAALRKAVVAWQGGWSGYGESTDPYVAQCFGSLETVADEFRQLNHALIEPALLALEPVQ
jgi:exonuclease V gamma subunit